MRLIDADKLEYELGCSDEEIIFKETLREAPTVDATPVVRCKHCKHRCFNECPMCHEEWYDYVDDGGYWESDFRVYDYTEDEGFCHKGEFEDGD